MSCCALPGFAGPQDCPICGARSKPVTRVTLEHLLRPERLGELIDASFFFCETPECDVVYYAEGGRRLFDKDDLTVRVGVKERDDPVPVCYCFGHSERDIVEDVQTHGRSTIYEAIKDNVRAGLCACEVTNPSGRCCLGNVQKAIQKARPEVPAVGLHRVRAGGPR